MEDAFQELRGVLCGCGGVSEGRAGEAKKSPRSTGPNRQATVSNALPPSEIEHQLKVVNGGIG